MVNAYLPKLSFTEPISAEKFQITSANFGQKLTQNIFFEHFFFSSQTFLTLMILLH